MKLPKYGVFGIIIITYVFQHEELVFEAIFQAGMNILNERKI